MNGTSHPRPILDLAHEALAGVDPAPFTAGAFRVLQERIDDHIEDLVLESIRIMKRHRSDSVSAEYVNDASRNLSSAGRRKWFTMMGTLGGILLGAAVSSFLEMARTSTVGGDQAVVAGVLSAAGAALIALQFARE